MPKCIRCGEEILRGNYCAEHRLVSGSTLGTIDDDFDDLPGRDGGYRDDGDEAGIDERDDDHDSDPPVYRE